MVDFNGATWIPSPNYFPNRYGHTPSYVILHGTAGGSSAQAIAQNIFAISANQVSAHYVIGQDGTVVQTVDESDAAWANGPITDGAAPWWTPTLNPNLITVSIEHVKPSIDNSDQLTSAQQDSSFRLVQDICNRWHIPKRIADENGGITGHFSMDPVSRSRCPGNYPWDALFQYLGGEGMIDISNPIVASFFQQISATNWKCKKNNAVMGGDILKFYCQVGGYGLCGLTLLGLPLGNEYNDTGYKNVAKQQYERGIVVFDPQHQCDNPPGSANCYLQHMDAFYALPTQIASLKNTIAADTSQLEIWGKQIADLKTQLATDEQKINTLNQQLTTKTGVTPTAISTILSQIQTLETQIKTIFPTS